MDDTQAQSDLFDLSQHSPSLGAQSAPLNSLPQMSQPGGVASNQQAPNLYSQPSTNETPLSPAPMHSQPSMQTTAPAESVKTLMTENTPPTILHTPTPPVEPLTKSTQTSSAQSVFDAFQHILLFIGLFTMSTSITLMMQFFVDKALTQPKAATSTDALAYVSTYLGDFQSVLLKMYISAFLIGAPLFAWMFISIARKDKADTSRVHSPWRLLVISFALIIPVTSLLYDLGTIVYHLLSWDLSLLAGVHSLVGMSLNAIILSYYAWSLYQGSRHEN